MDVVKKFTENIVMSLVSNPEIVKVQDFTDEDGSVILEIIVDKKDMGVLIGKSGKTIKSVRILVQSCAHKQGINRIRVNVDSI